MKHLILTLILALTSLSSMATDNYAKNGGMFVYNVNNQFTCQYNDNEFNLYVSYDKVSHSKKNKQGKYTTTYQWINWQTLTSDIPTFIEYCLYAQEKLQGIKLYSIQDNIPTQLKEMGKSSIQGKIAFNNELQYQFDYVITSKGEIYTTLWIDSYRGPQCVGRFTQQELLILQKNIAAAYAAFNARNQSKQVKTNVNNKALNKITNTINNI